MVLYYLQLTKLQPEHKVFVLVIANFVAPIAEEITQSADQVRMRLISQLIKTISRVSQKLLKFLMVLLF